MVELMLTRRSAISLCLLAGLWFLTNQRGRQLPVPAALHAQADSSRSQQRPAAQPSAPAPKGTPAARALFQQHCAKCHGADGTGSPARSRLPEIPDFTAAAGPGRKSEAQLLASILDGKGKE